MQSEPVNIPGTLSCQKGYVFNGTSDLVFCHPNFKTYVKGDPAATCIDDPFSKFLLQIYHSTDGADGRNYALGVIYTVNCIVEHLNVNRKFYTNLGGYHRHLDI